MAMAFQRSSALDSMHNSGSSGSYADYEDALYQVASRVTGGSGNPYLFCNPPRSVSKSPSPPPAAMTYDPGGFKYNLIVIAIFIPGFLFVLNFCGDLLPAIIAIGAFVVHLMCSAREHSGAVIMVLLIWIICQFLILYKTCMFLFGLLTDIHLFVSHIPLVIFTNIFSVLTLAWVLMMFREFRSKDYRLLRVIESSMFTLYPVSTSVLISYVIVHWTDVWIAPYAFIITGFVYLNVTLKPRDSSFTAVVVDGSADTSSGSSTAGGQKRAPPASASTPYIVESNVGIVTLITYLFIPMCTLSVCKLWYTTQQHPPAATYYTMLLSSHLLYTLVEAGFALSMTVFLSTFIHIRFYLLSLDILSMRGISVLRWITGACAISLLELLSSAVVPKLWMSLFPTLLAVHIILIYSINTRKSKQVIAFICVILLLAYLGIMSTLPWNLDYHMSSLKMHTSLIQSGILCNAVLCVFILYVSSSSSHTNLSILALSVLLLLQNAVESVCEMVLYLEGISSTLTLVLTSFLSVYLIYRLTFLDKVNHVISVLLVSVHACKLLYILFTAYSVTLHLYHIVIIFLWALVGSKCVLFEYRMLTLTEIYKQVCLMFILSFTFMYTSLCTLWVALMDEQPLITDCIGCCLMLTSALLVKYSLYNVGDPNTNPTSDSRGSEQQRVMTSSLRHTAATLLVMALALFVIEPELVVTWGSVYVWMVYISTCCVTLTILNLLPITDDPLLCMVTALVMGSTAAIHIFITYGIASHINQCVLYMASASMVAFCILFSWKLSQHIESALLYSYIILGVSDVCLLLTYKEADVTLINISICYTASTALILAANGKLYSVIRKYPSKSSIPTMNNVLTLTAFSLFISYHLIVQSQPYMLLLCSLTLLLLQPDLHLLYSLPPHAAPLISITVTSASLWLLCLATSAFWHATASVGAASTVWRRVAAHVELAALVVVAAPVTVTLLLRAVWRVTQEACRVTDHTIVMLTPLTLLLLPTASTWYVWGLVALDFTLAVRLLYTLLPPTSPPGTCPVQAGTEY